MKRYLMRTLWIGILVMLAGAVWAVAAGAETSGTCGDNVTWVLDDKGTLTISGQGNMTDYWMSQSPWDRSLKKVLINEGVTSIGTNSFDGCTELTEVILPNSVNSIGLGAFYNCQSITSIGIPESVTSIGNGAFNGCSNLNSIVIPNNVTSISSYTFCDCNSMQNIILSDRITSIADYAFSRCSNLSEIVIPDGVTTIGMNAFESCKSLSRIVLPANLKRIERATFMGCDSLEQITTSDSINYIGDSAFAGCRALTEISIPYGVNYIGNSAFVDCRSLTSLDLPDSITHIGSSAFHLCISVKKIHIPSNLREISDSAFGYCESLRNIILPENLTSLGKEAFASCEMLETIRIPNGITSIGEGAFFYCKNLEKVVLPNGLTSIGKSAFMHCRRLPEISIPESVASIGDSAFESCIGLTKLYFACRDTILGNNMVGSTVGTCTIFCYEYSDVDTWATASNFDRIVYIDTLDVETIRKIQIDPIGDLEIGQSETINPYIFPDPHNEAITWSSTDPSVVSVANGTITGIGAGSASLIVTVGDTSVSTDVYVYMPAQSFELDQTEVWVLAKDNIQLFPVDILPDGAETRITWTSSDAAFATVDDKGFIKTYKPGEVMITATDKTGFKRTCRLYICYPVTAVEIEEETLTLESFTSETLNVTVTTQNDTYINHFVCFTSSDEIIATVDQDGIVTGRSPGTTTITVTSANGISATCQIVVLNSGHCGSTMTWMLSDDGHLTISGSGSMNDYSTIGIGPWGLNIQTITIDNGVTGISGNAFCSCSALSRVTIPDTVRNIGEGCFPKQKETLYVQCSSYAHEWARDYGYANIYDNPDLAYGYISLNHKNLDTAMPIAPTCTQTGSEGGSCCLDCGETVDIGQIIPALGHDWMIPTYEWNLDSNSITATHICTQDEEHTESETVSISRTTKIEPTCEENGVTLYTSGMFDNPSFTVQTIEKDDIPAVGHNWSGMVSIKQLDDGITAIASCPCTRDPSHLLTETIQIKFEVDQAPTETERGFTKKSYTFYNKAFAGWSYWISTDDIPALRDMGTVRLPVSLNAISDEAFEGTVFEAIIVPDGCRSIGARAFANCPNLIYVRIPASVTSIADDAFVGSNKVRIDKQD